MKRIYFVGGLMMLLGCLLMTSCSRKANEVRMKKGEYSRQDELNDRLAEWTKEGWKIHGTTRTLRGQLQQHYDRMDANPNLTERVGTATNCVSVTVCRLAALNGASLDYATAVASEVKGAFERDMTLNESNGEEFSQFHAAFAGKVDGRIRGELEESFALIKSENGKNHYQIYFLLDKEKAKSARLSAMKDAVEESKTGMEFGSQVRKYVQQATGEGIK